MQYSNQYTNKTTITDSDISKSYDNTGGVKTTWLNIWNNFLKLKADLLYSSKFMMARTIKANILVTNNNVSDVSFDQFQTALANTSSAGMAGIFISLSTTDKHYIRLTSCSAIGSIANGLDGKKIIIFNATGSTISIIHEYTTGTVATDRISCKFTKILLNNTSAEFIYDSVVARWILIDYRNGNFFNGYTNIGYGAVTTENIVLSIKMPPFTLKTEDRISFIGFSNNGPSPSNTSIIRGYISNNPVFDGNQRLLFTWSNNQNNAAFPLQFSRTYICSGISSNNISLFTPPATSSQGESSGTLGNNVVLPFNYNTSTCYFIYTMQTDNANTFNIKSLYMNHTPL